MFQYVCAIIRVIYILTRPVSPSLFVNLILMHEGLHENIKEFISVRRLVYYINENLNRKVLWECSLCCKLLLHYIMSDIVI